MAGAAPIQNRPYRSHKVPACTRCRSRKIRCHIDIPGEPCLSCRERRLKCQYIATSATNSPTDENERKTPKRRRHSVSDEEPSRVRSPPVLHKPTNTPSASIMLAPHVAEDVDIFHRHVLQHRKPGLGESSSYQTVLHDACDPVVYTTVPRFRTGLPPNSGCGQEQLEILSQIMGPFKREVIELYFNHIHFHFPVLDNETCENLRNGDFSGISNNLMCVIYCVGSPLWSRSDTLKMHPRPDSHYVWNKGISATIEDFLSPGVPTIQASVLDQIGRPSVSIIGNITLCGRTLALAQTFGLHRDPSKWNITENEKWVRIRAWWCVLITDSWSSVAYGAPPHITPGYFDVPKPTLSGLITSKATTQQKQATTCFIHLCALTELLGKILPLVYEINPDSLQLGRDIDRFQRELDNLEQQLPEWLPLPNRPGTPNLWLCFLSIRLVLARVIFRAAILDNNTNQGRDRMDHLHIASSAVLDFILTLGEIQFQDFWLPYATHLLVHAITVSLRCTVETQEPEIRNTSIRRLERVIAHIQFARDNYDWDIAIYCLERCADSVATIASLNMRDPMTTQLQLSEIESNVVASHGAGPVDPASVSGDVSAGGGVAVQQTIPNFDDASFLLSDILDPNAFDFSWNQLWDTPNGMTNFSI